MIKFLIYMNGGAILGIYNIHNLGIAIRLHINSLIINGLFKKRIHYKMKARTLKVLISHRNTRELFSQLLIAFAGCNPPFNIRQFCIEVGIRHIIDKSFPADLTSDLINILRCPTSTALTRHKFTTHLINTFAWLVIQNLLHYLRAFAANLFKPLIHRTNGGIINL